jgi:hypothetical protein
VDAPSAISRQLLFGCTSCSSGALFFWSSLAKEVISLESWDQNTGIICNFAFITLKYTVSGGV